MWLSATKGGFMKDTKPKVTIVTNNIRVTHHSNGEYVITFLIPTRVRWDFVFSKANNIKYSHFISGTGNQRNVSQKNNWRLFKKFLSAYGDKENIPSWIKALSRWRFDNTVGIRLVEDKIGCLTFFKKEEH